MDFVLCSGKSELLRLKLLNIKHSLFMRHPVVSFNDKATLEPLMLREVRNTHQLLLSLLLVCSLSGQLCLGLLCSLSLSFQTFGLFSGPLPLLLQLQGLTSLLLQFCKTTHTLFSTSVSGTKNLPTTFVFRHQGHKLYLSELSWSALRSVSVDPSAPPSLALSSPSLSRHVHASSSHSPAEP